MIRAACCLLVLVASVARADSPKLDEARSALDQVRYDEAATLLAAALREGNNSPAALAEIYRLSASTAIVLGDADAARAAYRRWLSLDPKASLPSTAAVKFQDPFISAQAFTATNGAFVVKIGVTKEGTIAVSIQSDPLKLATSVALDGSSSTAFAGAKRITLRVPAKQAAVRVIVFDEHGNQLVARSFATLSAIPADTVATLLYRRWPLWAISAGLVGGGGLYAHSRARAADRELDAIDGTADQFFFADVEAVRQRRSKNLGIARGLYVGAGVLGATAVVFYLLQPRRKHVVTPMVDGGAGIAVTSAF